MGEGVTLSTHEKELQSAHNYHPYTSLNRNPLVYKNIQCISTTLCANT